MTIFLTGATGFLGSYLVKYFSKRYKTVYVLTRKSTKDFEEHFKDLPNVKAIHGDITHFDVLGVEALNNASFLSTIDTVVHAAALYDLKASYSDCFVHNVVGTQNIMHLLKSMKNLKAFYPISTIAVADPDTYFLDEMSLPLRVNFSDAYSATKYQAEKIIRANLSSQFTTRIIRPGIIIGDSDGSPMPKVDGPYYFLESFKKHASLVNKVPFIPLSFNPKAKIPFIPVDHCARFIDLIISRTEKIDNHDQDVKAYHLISHEIPNLKEFLGDVNSHFGIKSTFLPMKKNVFHDFLLNKLGIPKQVLPFMFSKLSYDRTHTLEDLPELEESTYSSYKNILFK